jgi:FkbM family methyltransferase
MSADFIANIIRGYFSPNYGGTLLEVGAAHPVDISISYPLRGFGWNIISVEPNPKFVEAFKAMNLPILPYAACAEDIGKTTFEVSPNLVSCSAIKVKDAYRGYDGWTNSSYKVIEVEALTLDTILQKHHPELKSIDALLVDTEGWELEVLAGFNLEKFNPKIVCLENVQSLPAYVEYMTSKNYKLDRKEEQDEFYIKM